MTDSVKATTCSPASQSMCGRWTSSFCSIGKIVTLPISWPLSWLVSKVYKPRHSVEVLTDPRHIVERFAEEPYRVLCAFVSLLVTHLPKAEERLKAIVLDYKSHPEKYQVLRSLDHLLERIVLSPETLDAYNRFETLDHATGREAWKDHERYRAGQQEMACFNKTSIASCVYEYSGDLFADLRLPRKPGITLGRFVRILQQQRDIGCLAGVQACSKWLVYIEAIVFPQLLASTHVSSRHLKDVVQLAQPLFAQPKPVAEMISRLVLAYMPELRRTPPAVLKPLSI